MPITRCDLPRHRTHLKIALLAEQKTRAVLPSNISKAMSCSTVAISVDPCSAQCATPNHGIIADGVCTSKKKLCSDSSSPCIQQTKLVNNLKLAANRRAVASDRIVVTPYDVRFPKAVIWAVHILEDRSVSGCRICCSCRLLSFYLLYNFSVGS